MRDDVFTKQVYEPGAAQAEAAGLRWLAEASPQVVEVVAEGRRSIATKKVNLAPPTMAAAFTAGEELAKIHLAGAPAFGSPPPGWHGPYFIGTQQQPCVPELKWGKFYVEQRVLPFIEPTGVVEQALTLILETDWEVAPARIHGDLWSGNLIYGRQDSEVQPFFIDPAAHGGHPVTDLAMLALFNAPYLEDIYTGYESINPLPGGWREFIPVHQMHPLAVHSVTHGPGYAQELVRVSQTVVKLLG